MDDESDVAKRALKRIGSVLRGKYRLDRLLGAGGMASVYAATHRNQKQFAIKMLHPELSVHDDIRARFLREGYAANSVKHPGAVAVLDDDTAEDGSAFLVMELLEGTTVEGWWERSSERLDARAVLAVGFQLLDVLAAAHARAIVHRDIKPANLFVTTSGELKVLDFGIARVRALAASDAGATNTGVLLGTPAFMAPEQALGKTREVDARTDLWSVGATMFTLLTGQPVFEGETAQAIMVRCATTPAPSLGAVLEGAAREVVLIVDRALASQRDARWPTAEAMRDAVRGAHVSLFGSEPSKAYLAARVASPDAARDGGPGTTRRLVDAASPGPASASSGPGKTTAQPVATSGGRVVASGASGRTRVLVASAAGVFMTAVAAFLVSRSGLHREAASASEPPARAVATAEQTPAPPSAIVSLAPRPAESASADAPLASREPADVASVAPATRSRPATVAATPKKTAPRPSATPKPKPSCNPNYYLDSDGNQHFKPECFQ